METKRLKSPLKMKALFFLGKFMFNMFCCMEMYYFAAYLTDKALLPVALAGLALNIPTVVDTILSFLNGAIIEKLPHPIGKYRFWMFVSPVVATITYALCYVRFDDDMFCTVMIIVMLIIAHFFWSIAENVFNSLPAIITDDMSERSSLSMLHQAGASWSSFVFGLIALPIITFFNNMMGSTTNGYAVATAMFGILYIIFFVFVGVNLKEVEAAEAAAAKAGKKVEKAKGPSLGVMLSNVVKNPPLLVLMLYSLFSWTNAFLTSGMMAYYFNCTLGAMAMMGITMSMRSVGGMITPFIYPFVMKIFKGNKRNVVIFGNLVNAIRLLVIWFVRPGAMAFAVSGLICTIIGGVAGMPLLAMYSDCATYGEWKTGVSSKSFVMSMYGIPIKIGLAAKGFIITGVLAAVSYNATLDPGTYADAFNNAYCLLLGIILIVGSAILLVGYHLTEAKVIKAANEVQERQAAAKEQ